MSSVRRSPGRNRHRLVFAVWLGMVIGIILDRELLAVLFAAGLDIKHGLPVYEGYFP